MRVCPIPTSNSILSSDSEFQKYLLSLTRVLGCCGGGDRLPDKTLISLCCRLFALAMSLALSTSTQVFCLQRASNVQSRSQNNDTGQLCCDQQTNVYLRVAAYESTVQCRQSMFFVFGAAQQLGFPVRK